MSTEHFTLLHEQEITALDLRMEEFIHEPTGAKHYHLASASSENAFMVAFRTLPENDCGVAHILEHTVLCGSERFPVRDPFFMMLRRSLNTFMNAFTSNDYTAYPFASENRKDYFNLMAVYLDAVFFSRLHPLDFAQEGCRLEFEQAHDAETPLVYRGVVYNEMKGATSSPITRLYDAVQAQLYPTTTYHYNSGGDPAAIPELSYESMLDFYKTHYHPGNAIFMTFGDISAQENQAEIMRLSLNRFEASSFKQPPPIVVPPEVRYQSPIHTELTYPLDEEDQSEKTHIVFGWLLGENTDLEMLLRCQLVSDVLLGTSASPLSEALEKTPLASAPSPLCGFQQEPREMHFICGVEGSDPEHAEAIEDLVLAVLTQVAEEGIPSAQLEAVLHQLELSQREVGGDGLPYGLQLIFTCISAAMHRGNPIGLLDLEAALARLQAEITDPEFIKSLVRELLLDNPHRVRVVMKPDRHLGAAMLAEEATKLATLKAAMTEPESRQAIALAEALDARQKAPEDEDVLPRLQREDIPRHKDFYRLPSPQPGQPPITACAAGTNGIAYYQLVTELPAITRAQLDLLPFYSALVTEVGSADRDYRATQHLQHRVSGGIAAFPSIQTPPDDSHVYEATYHYSSMALNRKAAPMVSLLMDTAQQANFNEYERVREVVRLLALRRLNSIAGKGHRYAVLAACAPLGPIPTLNNRLTGIPGILALKALDDALDDDDRLRLLASELGALQQTLSEGSSQVLAIAEANFLPELTDIVARAWQEPSAVAGQEPSAVVDKEPSAVVDVEPSGVVDKEPSAVVDKEPSAVVDKEPSAVVDKEPSAVVDKEPSAVVDVEPSGVVTKRPQAYVITTQVNFCASAFETVPETHPDAVPLWLLASLIRNHFLHAELREKGGAYGGGASYGLDISTFCFYSYRDPNIHETFSAFERAVDWVLKADIKDDMLDEAVLGVMSSIDSPASPAGEILQAYRQALSGRDAAHREKLRRRVLEVRVSDIKRVAADYLTLAGSKALITSENRLGEIDQEFETIRITAD